MECIGCIILLVDFVLFVLTLALPVAFNAQCSLIKKKNGYLKGKVYAPPLDHRFLIMQMHLLLFVPFPFAESSTNKEEITV